MQSCSYSCARCTHAGSSLEDARRGDTGLYSGGKRKEILEIGKSLGHEIDPADVIDSQTDEDAVEKGIQLVREGKADFIQKGLLQTSTLLKGVVDKEKGIRTGKAMSHVALLDVPTYHKILGVTDGGMMMYPDLAKKKDIAINAVESSVALGMNDQRWLPSVR